MMLNRCITDQFQPLMWTKGGCVCYNSQILGPRFGSQGLENTGNLTAPEIVAWGYNCMLVIHVWRASEMDPCV